MLDLQEASSSENWMVALLTGWVQSASDKTQEVILRPHLSSESEHDLIMCDGVSPRCEGPGHFDRNRSIRSTFPLTQNDTNIA